MDALEMEVLSSGATRPTKVDFSRGLGVVILPVQIQGSRW
jgi:hypothetical protein